MLNTTDQSGKTTATISGSTAIGKGAKVNGAEDAAAVGTSAQVNETATGGMAFGKNAVTGEDKGTVTVGDVTANVAAVGGENSVALGTSAKASGNTALALGNGAQVNNYTTQSGTTVTKTVNSGSTAIGSGAVVTGANDAVAFGSDAKVEGTGTNADDSLAIGKSASVATAKDAMALGTMGKTWNQLTRTSVIGYGNKVNQATSITSLADTQILGNDVTATLGNSVYLGTGSSAKNANSPDTDTLVKAETDAANAVDTTGMTDDQKAKALSDAKAKARYAVKLAAMKANNGSTAGTEALNTDTTYDDGTNYTYAGSSPVGVVTVGSAGKERRIQNVAAGLVSATSTDAVNGSQLYALTRQIRFGGDNSSFGKTTAADDQNVVARGSNETISITGGSDAVKSSTADGTTTYTVDATKLTGNNIAVVADKNANALHVQLASNLKELNTAQLGSGSGGSYKETIKLDGTGNSGGSISLSDATGILKNTMDTTGMSLTSGAKFTSSGISAGSQQINNVTAGTSDTDAVNYGQLKNARTLLTKGANTTLSDTVNGDQHTYTVNVDNLAVKANGTGTTVALANGINFKNGSNTTSAVDNNGNVTIDTKNLTLKANGTNQASVSMDGGINFKDGTNTTATVGTDRMVTISATHNKLDSASYTASNPSDSSNKTTLKLKDTDGNEITLNLTDTYTTVSKNTDHTITFKRNDGSDPVSISLDDLNGASKEALTTAAAKATTQVIEGANVSSVDDTNAGNTDGPHIYKVNVSNLGVKVADGQKTSVALSDGLVFGNGTNTTASVGQNGAITFNVSNDAIKTQAKDAINMTAGTNVNVGTETSPDSLSKTFTISATHNALKSATITSKSNDVSTLTITGNDGDTASVDIKNTHLTVTKDSKAKTVTFTSNDGTTPATTLSLSDLGSASTADMNAAKAAASTEVKAGTNASLGTVETNQTDQHNGSQLYALQQKVTNGGWDIIGDNENKSTHIGNDKTVSFKSGKNSTVSVTGTDTGAEVKVDVNTAQISTNDAHQATATGTGLADASEVVNAINSAAWNVQKKDGAVQQVKAGDTVTFDAGNNIVLAQNDKSFTYGLASDVNTNSIRLGGSQDTNGDWTGGIFIGKQIGGGANQNEGNYITGLANTSWDLAKVVDNKNLDLSDEGSLRVGSSKVSNGAIQLGEDASANKILMDSTNGTASIGGVTVNGAKKTVNGLSNTKWTGTAVDGQAATENQLVEAINEAKTQAANSELHIKKGVYAIGKDSKGQEITDKVGKNSVSIDVVNAKGTVDGQVVINDVAKASELGAVGELAANLKNPAGGSTTVVQAVNKVNQKVDDSLKQVNGDISNAVTEARKHTEVKSVDSDNNVTIDGTTTNAAGGTVYKLGLNKEHLNLGNVHIDGNKGRVTAKTVEAEMVKIDDQTRLDKKGLTTGNTTVADGRVVVGGDNGIKIEAKGDQQTISGLSNRIWTGKAVRGRAATEDQLQQAVENATATVAQNEQHIQSGNYDVGQGKGLDGKPISKNSVAINVVSGDGTNPGDVKGQVVINNVAKADELGDVAKLNGTVRNGNGHPTSTVDAINNLDNRVETKVGDNTYSRVKGKEIDDGDSATTAIGKLNNRMNDIYTTAGQHSTVSTADANLTLSEGKNASGGTDYKLGLNKENINLGNVTINGNAGSIKADSFTAGDTVVNKDGVKVGDKSALTGDSLKVGGKTYVDDKGINANGKAIGNVGDGKNDGDAVNVKQVNDLAARQGEAIGQNAAHINQLDRAVNRLDSRINRVGAGAAALAALHPGNYDPDDKVDFAAGFGNYRGASAAAVGMYYHPDETTTMSVGASFGGGEDLFPDVPENHWAYDFVAKLAQAGALKDCRVEDPANNPMLTRNDFAQILYTALKNGATKNPALNKDGGLNHLANEFRAELKNVKR